MKNIMTKCSVLISVLALSACGGFGDDEFDTEVNDITYTSGELDFSKYVAIGDSLTAGYADGTVYRDGQINSFPNILAGRFAEVGGGEFTQPLVSDNVGGLTLGGNPVPDGGGLVVTRRVLYPNPNYDPTNPTSSQFLPAYEAGTPTTEITSVLSGNFNNMGVPGAKSFHLLAPGYGNIGGFFDGVAPVVPATANPYFIRMASSATASVLADVAAQTPTFFSLWIGNNDVLGYATTGGDDSDPITAPATFNGTYDAVIASIKGNGASGIKGVLMNIPSITDIPFFTTIPYNYVYLKPDDVATQTALNTAYAAYNAGIAGALAGGFISSEEAAKRTLQFELGQFNPIVVIDETLTNLGPGVPFFRKAEIDERILLTGASQIALGPLEDKYYLNAAEISNINTAVEGYNAKIKEIADNDPDIALLDAASLLSELKSTGINYGAGSVNADFVTGGAFSLDGVHLTARGNAVIANSVMETLESNFGATLKKVNPINYTTVFFNEPN